MTQAPGLGIDNLPLGVAEVPGRNGPRVVVALGEDALDLVVLAAAGLLDVDVPWAAFAAPSLNPLLAEGPDATRAIRARLAELVVDGTDLATGRVPRSSLRMLLPIEVADYVDFYSSLQHATNLGRLFRPGGEPLLPNWRRLPVGYHGRAGTVVVSGTDVVRPHGQVLVDGEPRYQPSAALDIELEVGAVIGTGSAPGTPVAIADAGGHVAGLVLLNDWSARDIQSFEYQPLGPFLGKSFATSISAWLVTLDALAPFRVAPPPQDPPVEPYLHTDEPWAFDLHLEVVLDTAAMRAAGLEPVTVSHTDFADMYWTIAQQVAHTTANGASLRTGDLLGSGTVSGPVTASQAGSFIELTWRGTHPIALPTGESRTFLEDGDRVTLRGWCGEGDAKVSLGDVTGTILPAIGPS